jgi:hypothetical protein
MLVAREVEEPLDVELDARGTIVLIAASTSL